MTGHPVSPEVAWQVVLAHREALEADIARLRQELANTVGAATAAATASTHDAAKVERLRAALIPFCRLDYDIGDEWREVCERARAAMEDSR